MCLIAAEAQLSLLKGPMLRRGASSGEGLGNAFLSNIAAVDGIFHVCRAFEDADVVHVEDRVDPVEDLEIIHKCAARTCMLPCSLRRIHQAGCVLSLLKLLSTSA